MMHSLNTISLPFLTSKRRTVWLFILIYATGLTGIILHSTRQYFIPLTPVILLLSFLTLFLHRESKIDIKAILTFLVITFAGFFVEVAGVNTGYVFGSYTYGDSLGFKLFNTPLLIGINWIMLVYASFSIVQPLNIHPQLKILGASAIMLLYDLMLEQIAPVLEMWHWENNKIPFRNYLAWFIISLIFQNFMKWMNIREGSKMAMPILLCHIVFFLLLIIYFNFVR